jgi:hypothetical protein
VNGGGIPSIERQTTRSQAKRNCNRNSWNEIRDQDIRMDDAIGLEGATSPNLADICGADKLFVAVARISTDAF